MAWLISYATTFKHGSLMTKRRITSAALLGICALWVGDLCADALSVKAAEIAARKTSAHSAQCGTPSRL